ncbi:MAG: hypothetical protein CVV50_01145, partial [Spirochaetae bacterium HGW-Spirochaetae-6]
MKALITYFASNKLIVNVFILTVFIGGIFTLSSLRRETYPNVDMKQITINTPYPGAAPSDVELNVSKKIEDELARVNGLEKYISVSAENMSMIRVWIDMNEKKPDEVKRDVRNAVDRAEAEFPAEAEKSVITEIKTEIMPILHYLIASDSLSEKELREIADNMEDELKDVAGVSSVTKQAYRDAEFQVFADMEKMRFRDVSLEQIKKAIQGYNIRAGGGSLQSLTNQKNIVTMSQFKNIKEVEDVIIRSNFEGQRVRIRDIADASTGFAKREIYARGNQKNGILLIVNKKENADIIRTADDVKNKVATFYQKINEKYGNKADMEDIRSKSLSVLSIIEPQLQSTPKNKKLLSLFAEIKNFVTEQYQIQQCLSFANKQKILDLSFLFEQEIIHCKMEESKKQTLLDTIRNARKEFADQVNILKVMDITINTRTMLDITINNALIGFILVFLVLFAALDHKTAFWTAFGIPMALLMTFFGMKILGFSINVMSLFGIITVLGIVVDDGIVVSENIHQKFEQGMSGIRAAVEGAYEMIVPIIGSILTTILAFLPIAMMGGIMGQFIYQLPIMVILALLASLLEVYMGLPCHLAHGKEVKEKKEGKFIKAMIKLYQNILSKGLKYRYLIVALFIFLLLFSFRVLKSMDFILFSNKETEKIYITLEGKLGVNLEEMLSRVKEVEKIIAANVPYEDEMQAIVSTVGNKTVRNEVSPNQENYGKIDILLVPFAQRERSALDIVKFLQPKLNTPQIRNLFDKLVIKPEEAGPPVGAPVDVKFVSNNDQLRKEFAGKLKIFLQTQPGVFSIEDDNENVKEEIQLSFDYDKMYQLGVTPQVVASTVRMGFYGQAVTSISQVKEDVDVTIQLQDRYRYNIELLKQLLIPTSYNGQQIKLGQITYFPVVKTQSKIMRYNGKRTTNVTAQVDTDQTNATKVTKAILTEFAPQITQYPELRMLIGGEAEKSQESLMDAARAFIL